MLKQAETWLGSISTGLHQARFGSACSADFPVCRIAGFLTCRAFEKSSGLGVWCDADWKVGDTAGWKTCATKFAAREFDAAPTRQLLQAGFDHCQTHEILKKLSFPL